MWRRETSPRQIRAEGYLIDIIPEKKEKVNKSQQRCLFVVFALLQLHNNTFNGLFIFSLSSFKLIQFENSPLHAAGTGIPEGCEPGSAVIADIVGKIGFNFSVSP